jgi:predicted RNase H-like nuclease (RuvC/YqgF family)
MSYEVDNLKREVQQLKYDLTRKVEDESFRRKISDLDERIKRLDFDIQETNRRIDLVREHLNIDQP